MSSTNRSSARKEHVADYYVTPVTEIEKFLKHIHIKGKILDPCAGGDSLNKMSYPEALKNTYGKLDITTLDIREDSLAEIKENYLSYKCKNEYDVIITNPPFNQAFDIIKKALDDVKEGGKVIMLLRLNFLGSKERNNWLLNNPPNEIYVHAKRMSFVKGKGTDSIEYAHYIWVKGKKETTKLYLLDF